MKELQERIVNNAVEESLIIRTAVRLLVPFVQLFGLYVIAHGHYSPGGGFQGGVILGASFIMLALAYDLKTSLDAMAEKVNSLLGTTGVLVFFGVGLLCTLCGGLFLDYASLAVLLPLPLQEWRSLGIFFIEVGVGLAVMSIMVSLYWDLASGGDLKKGL